MSPSAPPSPTDPAVTYFGPGVHLLEEQPSWSIDKGSRGLQLQSHSTLYLAEGAVVGVPAQTSTTRLPELPPPPTLPTKPSQS